MEHKKIALVLAGGGARGIAHIGAIEELLRCGYEITAVAGTSMGALVGGMYAAGRLDAFRDWLCSLGRYSVFKLVDFSLRSDGLVKGDRVMARLEKLAADVRIEQLEIPFTAVAADLLSGEEILFREGGLYEAIRASISIPSFFRPVHHDGRVLVDGGMINPMPIDRVQRTEGDRLVAVDVSGPFTGDVGPHAVAAVNYYKVIMASSAIMQQRITELMCRLHRPDLLVSMPADGYGIFEFWRAREIVEAGRAATRRALEEHEGWWNGQE